MTEYASNIYYVDIDGTDVSDYVVSASFDPTVNTNETTAGSGKTHITRQEGLDDHSFSMDIAAQDDAAYSLALLKGTHTITFGEQGNASGKPKHVQSVILTGITSTTNVSKEMVVYSVSGDGAEAPSVDMFAGGVWA